MVTFMKRMFYGLCFCTAMVLAFSILLGASWLVQNYQPEVLKVGGIVLAFVMCYFAGLQVEQILKGGAKE
ncbi:hypothetical protein CHUUTOTORO_02080 [Serratia phage vB_SmaM-ChuuTotoro]|nr:hypothetical protein CHUUTOTORO_02080 [Serratia phage vB_SmaM-ChuuTotoro]